MLRVLALCFIAVLCLKGQEAAAARFSGGYLLQVCEVDPAGRETVPGGHIACQAYISAIIDYHNMLQSVDLAPQIKICIPDDVTLNMLHAAVLAYLRKNSQHDGFIAAPAVITALHESYPCR